jgi:starch synthase
MSSVVPFYVKTAYRDEPSFAETKVVTSLYSKSLNDKFAGDFKQFVEFRDAKANLLGDYKDQFDFDELSKLAIDYSDGVIQAAPDVEKSLVDFAAGKNIPVLGYNEDFADAYETFYESLFPDENE